MVWHVLLSNKDAPSDEIAAAFGLPQMIADKAKIEEETSPHLADLPLRNSPCRSEKKI